MMYGLSENTITSIQKVFLNYTSIEKVIIYGSRAMGNFSPGSDIDITLKGDDLDLSILHKIENEIDELMLPYKFDISLFEHIQNAELIEHIKKEGKVFYERQS